MFAENSKVLHKQRGVGFVIKDLGESIVVRFDASVEICLPSDLEKVPDVADILAEGKSSSLQKFLPALQAQCIRSINDQWGVFSCSQIELLPHQLWVCRQARQKDPCRLMVADDVGLGKTIEAGIILSSFLASGRIHRLLILTPASLVEQWQDRIGSMFDIRLERYLAELDKSKRSFWQSENMVVASLDTLRLGHRGCQERLFAADPWDLVIVDEAHHLNCDEKNGPTLSYQLIQTMEKRNLIRSLLFFTGTPHKGKDFNFLSLMKLLDEKVFDPSRQLSDQLEHLKDYMIRNNKYNVTDLRGNRLFTEPIVKSATYSYTPEEQKFYDTLTEFITKGMAYAGGLDHGLSRIVIFVLITMQKLASSSVAAVRHAIERRLQKTVDAKKEEEKLKCEMSILANVEDESLDDRRAEIEEELPGLAEFVSVADDETSYLETLLRLADQIHSETKICCLLDVVAKEYPEEQILFFTEYKATQSALMSALMKEYGTDSVTFINGDGALESVALPDGRKERMTVSRQTAASWFNGGKCRFLIATEAGGEGIDLQERCHILFHVDLPWNPMRLHQRVGRLNRYGQKKQVIVRNFRNPATVESRIWDKLTEKLANINRAFSAVMEQKEDMFQLVLGMTPQSIFTDLFANAPHNGSKETLSQWFDAKTATIGGQDVFRTVQDIAGNAAKFNYNQASKVLPHVDLPDLLPFWENLMAYKHRRLIKHGGTIEFNTPEDWMAFGIKPKYDNLIFARFPAKEEKPFGVGHKVFDAGLAAALSIQALVGISPQVQHSYLVFSLHDHVTDKAKEKFKRYYACEVDKTTNTIQVLPDWRFLAILNGLKPDGASPSVSSNALTWMNEEMPLCIAELKKHLATEEFIPRMPIFNLEAILFGSLWWGK